MILGDVMTRKIVSISILVLVILLGVLIFNPAITKTKHPSMMRDNLIVEK